MQIIPGSNKITLLFPSKNLTTNFALTISGSISALPTASSWLGCTAIKLSSLLPPLKKGGILNLMAVWLGWYANLKS